MYYLKSNGTFIPFIFQTKSEYFHSIFHFHKGRGRLLLQGVKSGIVVERDNLSASRSVTER